MGSLIVGQLVIGFAVGLYSGAKKWGIGKTLVAILIFTVINYLINGGVK